MRFLALIILAAGITSSTALIAFDENETHYAIIKASGQDELKALKDIHNHNNVFDDYQTGSIAPDVSPITPKKGN